MIFKNRWTNTTRRVVAAFAAVALLGAFGATSAGAAASPQLIDRAAAASLDPGAQNSWSVCPIDYNNDGLQDVVISHHEGFDAKLWRSNADHTFTLVATFPRRAPNGAYLDRHDCAVADVDGNGLPDIAFSAGRNQSNFLKTPEHDNNLYMQDSPGVFTDRGTELGVGEECSRGRYLAFIDVNGDGWKDEFTGTQTGRAVADPCDDPANGLPGEQPKIYLNNGGTGFTYSPQWSVSVANSGLGCAFAWDYNHDNLMDLVACRGASSTPVVYRNTGTAFVSSTTLLTAMVDGVLYDMNGDGILDLVFADLKGFGYRLGTATGIGPAVRIFNLTSPAVGEGIAVGDINGDHQPDVYGQVSSPSSNPDDYVFVNQGSLTFTQLTVPSAGGGGDSVAAIYPAGTSAPAQFVVLNGEESRPGPTQLIAWNG